MVQAKRKAVSRPKRAYHKGNVADDLLAVAARLLKEETVEAISVRRLTRELGVTPANFYNHYPSLEDLLLTLAADGFDELARDTRGIMDKAKSRRAGLIEACVSFVFFAMANKQLFRIMFGQIPNAVRNARFREASDSSFAQLANFIYRDTVYDPADIPRSHHRAAVAYGMFSMVYGLARNIIEDQFVFETGHKTEIRAFVEEVMATLMSGTAAQLFAAD